MHSEDSLASLLNFNTDTCRNYDVYVYELMDGSISDKDKNGVKEMIDDTNIKSLILQLIDGLGQLKNSDLSHNDIKPKNILYKTQYGDDEIEIILKISDFGQCLRSGGTPGWTPPLFQSKRLPGKADMYSMALVILYVLCEDTRIFYWLRDNFIVDENPNWLVRFRKLPEIELVMKMMDLKNQPTVAECKHEWNKILSSEEFKMITMDKLNFIPEDLLKNQLEPSNMKESDYEKFDPDNTVTNFDELSIKEKSVKKFKF